MLQTYFQPSEEETSVTSDCCRRLHKSMKSNELPGLIKDIKNLASYPGSIYAQLAKKIHHMIGWFASYITIANKFLRVVADPEMRSLLKTLRLRIVKSAPEEEVHIRGKSFDLDSILGRLAKSGEVEELRRCAHEYDKKYDVGLVERLGSWDLNSSTSASSSPSPSPSPASHYPPLPISSSSTKGRKKEAQKKTMPKKGAPKKLKTQVHAELQLISYLQRRDPITGHPRQFLYPKDPYIGCSKLACFLCTRYVAALDQPCKLRGSHEIIYLNWRPPDIDAFSKHHQVEEKKREGVLNRMTGPIRHLSKNRIMKLVRPDGSIYQPNSTTGITSSGVGHINTSSSG